MPTSKPLLLAALAVFAAPAQAKTRVLGEIAAEARAFTGDGDERTEDFNLGAFARGQVKTQRGDWRAKLRFLGRLAAVDPDRNRANVEEAWVSYRNAGWNVRAGVDIVNWSATEAFHPADVLNARNLDSNVENAEKIGEPMVSVERDLGRGGITLYYMPALIDPQIPDSSSRLSFLDPGLGGGAPLWADKDGSTSRRSLRHQGALRLAQTFGSADLALTAVRHQDRSQPTVFYDPATRLFHPVFHPVTHYGLTYQHALGAWVVKIESAWRDFDGGVRDHGEFAFGLENGWTHAGGAESTVILEGQTMFDANKDQRAALSMFQRDLLLGWRLAFNDAYSTELFASFIFDLERREEYLANVSFGRRITDFYSVKSGLRFTHAPQKGPAAVGLERLDDANQLYVNLIRSF